MVNFIGVLICVLIFFWTTRELDKIIKPEKYPQKKKRRA